MIIDNINFLIKKNLLKADFIEHLGIDLHSVDFTHRLNIQFQFIILISLSILNTKFVQEEISIINQKR